MFTGGLYGFFATMAKIIRETEATEALWCQDSKPYVRSIEYPEYKQLRKANRDEVVLERYKHSMGLVLGVLDAMGIHPWGLPGYESDDLFAYVAVNRRSRYAQIYGASNDSDLFQLLDIPNFAIYSKDTASVMTGAKLWKAQGLRPEQFMLMTAMMGTHNDVAGIDGVGPVTAKKALADPALYRSMRAKHAAIIDRNLRLIELPHSSFPMDTKLPVQGPIDLRAMYRALDAYDIDCTNAMVKAFEQLGAR